MQKRSMLIPLAILLALIPGMALADNAMMEELGSKAARIAMQELDVQKGDANLLILTDAGHAIIDGQTTQAAIKGLSAESGNSIGDGNLFQVLRAHFKPLWFYFFDKSDGEAVYLEVNSEALASSPEAFSALEDDKVFSKISKAFVDIDYLESHTDEGNATFNEKAFNGNEGSLIPISNVWARGGSFDFVQATCFHDHLCPGVTSGLFLAKYVEEKLPITNSSESYKVISCPNWCKEDLLQMRWDATPGKSGMFVMALSDKERKAVPGIAGIFIRWNSTSNDGDALVLAYNTSSMESDWTGPAWGSKIASAVALLNHTDSPDTFVSTIKEFKVDQEKLSLMQSAGMHPLKVAGVL